MGDSEDEYDRHRGRDKFRRERNDYNDRNTNNRREDWPESNWSSTQRDRNQRRDYRENYNSAGRANYNNRYGSGDRTGGMSPLSKRMRTGRFELDDRFPNYDLGSSGGGGNYHSGYHGGHNYRDNWTHDRDRDDEAFQPPMLTLKQFVNEQDDNLEIETLISKYSEYKNEFKRNQIQEFFNRHKDEEWFRCKYHPDEIDKRKAKSQQSYQNRLNVFMELLEANYFDNVSLDVDKGDQIVKVLDAAVIKLEGGTDFDLTSLNTELEENKVDSIFSIDSSSTTKASFTPASDDDKGEPKTTENDNDAEMKDNEEKPEDGEANTPKADMNEESGDGEFMEEGEDADKDVEEQEKNESSENEKKPRPLHKTCSIFFRNLAPSITRQEIEDECRKFPLFLRLALSEPQMDRRFNRRGWATYERSVNIREICWNLSNVKIRGTDISPIVNRDLTRRIRSVNGLSSHKTVVRADIRHTAKLIMKLDSQKNLWEVEKEDSKNNGSLAIPSHNPLLKNITDYLIEDAPAEEAELLSTTVEDPIVSAEIDAPESNENGSTAAEGTQLERDEELIKFLDRLLFYLRIVHSVDYYNYSEYPNEDEMPNRIGLIHARGLNSSSRATPVEITDYIKEQESKVMPMLQTAAVVTPEEAKKLGMKSIDESIEAFIKENTKELGEGKWLCPLSNKKFMGPEFVAKHILNKHMERVEQVKAETHYFNNYVLDPKRPQLPEHPINRPPAAQATNQQARNDPLLPNAYSSMYHRNQMGYGNRYPMYNYPPPLPADILNRKRRYRDLDAPLEDV